VGGVWTITIIWWPVALLRMLMSCPTPPSMVFTTLTMTCDLPLVIVHAVFILSPARVGGHF
jgi:hypothetical protein